MQIELDDHGPDRAVVSGRIVGAPEGTIELSLHVRTSTPTGSTVDRVASFESSDGSFSLERPSWPTSYVGQLLSTEWNLVARHQAGPIATHEIDISADAITIEFPAGHDDHQTGSTVDRIVLPVATVAAVVGLVGVIIGIATDRTWMWVIAGFLAFFSGVALAGPVQRARRRRAYGTIECRAEQRDDIVEFAVAADPPAGLGDVTATASLAVVEMTGQSDGERTGGTREHIAAQHTFELAGDGPNRWRGSLPMAALADAPLSQYRQTEVGTTAVSWVLRVRLTAPKAPPVERLIPLVALPAGLDVEHRPEFVDVPKLVR